MGRRCKQNALSHSAKFVIPVYRARPALSRWGAHSGASGLPPSTQRAETRSTGEIRPLLAEPFARKIICDAKACKPGEKALE